MTIPELISTADSIGAQIEYAEKSVKILAMFEELNRDAMRDARLDSKSREDHEGLWRAMGEQVQDELKLIERMKSTREEILNRLRYASDFTTEVASA